ncbi:MAG: cysteine--tRNA ligase [Limisphaerales bacterium]|jgi:cysteinyl-tRNA synthetase
MGLKIFNTLTRQLENFIPLDPEGKKVGMYCCGPTVYDYAHIGNWRTFVFADLVRRYLEFKGYNVCHVMNITDVDDKIIRRVKETGIPLKEYTSKYERAFFEDMAALNCRMPHHTPRATEHIKEMLDLISKLLQRGIAYQTADGTIWFSIQRYQQAGGQYGKLVKLNFDKMQVGSRVINDEYDKESFADFALWKARTPEDGEVYWDSPWGQGRPGWHIECSAMSTKWLGLSFDLHLGGEDLIFPHHEDEIAQSEGTGLYEGNRQFVKYWLHGAHLLVEGKKMSKSLGNFYTLRDLFKKGFNGREIRYLLLSAHYREPLNFTIEGLNGARSAISRIDECIGKLREIAGGMTSEKPAALLYEFESALDNDLNIPTGWAVVFEWIRALNKKFQENTLTQSDAASELVAWEKINSVLGIIVQYETNAPPDVMKLVEKRQEARKNKDYATADAIRLELRSKGWWVDDTPKGPKLKRL